MKNTNYKEFWSWKKIVSKKNCATVQLVPCKRPALEVMICLIRSVKNWSSFSVSFSISNVKTILYSIINSFVGAHCSIAFSIWMVTHRLRPSYNQLAQQNKQEHRNVLLRSQFFFFLIFDKNVHVLSWPWTVLIFWTVSDWKGSQGIS